jgi:hypothetical protein
MRQQAMVCDPDTPARRHPPANKCRCDVGPAQIEQGNDRQRMKRRDKEHGMPIIFTGLGRREFDYVLHIFM